MGTAPRPKGMTELVAINRCLRAIGDTPINSLPTDDNDVSDAGIIRAELLDVTRECCERGYYFNYEAERAFTPNASSNIIIPSTVASWTMSRKIRRNVYQSQQGLVPMQLTERYASEERRLYDKANQTDEFTNTVYLDVHWYMPFDEIPNPYRQYIAAEAALRFLVPNDGDQGSIGLIQKELAMAQIEMDKEEIFSSATSLWESDDVLGGAGVYNYGSGGRYGY